MNVFVTVALAELHKELKPYYSDIGRPSIDPELMIRMLIVGYCYGIRSERKLCQEVELHLAYRWFCKLDLEDKVPHHSTFSENRLGRFRESDLLRHIFERVVWAAMAMGLVKGEGFAVDASVMEANASRYHGVPPGEISWTDAQKQKRAVAEAGLPVICVETRHMQALLKAQINKTDRNYARGIAQMMRAALSPGADSEEKHEPVSDIDTVVVDSLKALDPEWPIREADISRPQHRCPRSLRISPAHSSPAAHAAAPRESRALDRPQTQVESAAHASRIRHGGASPVRSTGEPSSCRP